MNLPKIETIKTNFTKLTIDRVEIYFSYETPIAYTDYSKDGEGLVIRANDWSTTTGKHLNYINDDKKRRISGKEFEQKLSDKLSNI